MPQVGVAELVSLMKITLQCRTQCCSLGRYGRIWIHSASLQYDVLAVMNDELVLGRYDELQLWHALEVSHLKEAVSKLDNKLDATVSEGGLANDILV